LEDEITPARRKRYYSSCDNVPTDSLGIICQPCEHGRTQGPIQALDHAVICLLGPVYTSQFNALN
jgi:hypothetical protein